MLESQTVLATKTAEQTDTQTDVRLARPWSVIVHDDPVSLMSYVTKVFQDVFGYSLAKSERLMMEVHQDGLSAVWSGPREQAELHVSKLQARHLLATLEQVDG